MKRLLAALLVALGVAPAVHAGEVPELSADAWITRIAEALRIGQSMSAHAHVAVDEPGREDDFAFDMQLLRDAEAESRRTVIEMREVGDTNSIVIVLVERRGEPLTSWYWDIAKRRWLSFKGLLPTDPWADTKFRYEDLWFAEPSLRRQGKVRVVDESGRPFVQLESDPYFHYLRVVTHLDPVTGLPHRVRFIDTTGVPIREQHYEQITLIDGKPFPTIVRARDLVGGGETTITFGEVRFGRRVPPSFFDLSVMDDRLRRGADPLPEPPDLRDPPPPADPAP